MLAAQLSGVVEGVDDERIPARLFGVRLVEHLDVFDVVDIRDAVERAGDVSLRSFDPKEVNVWIQNEVDVRVQNEVSTDSNVVEDAVDTVGEAEHFGLGETPPSA